MQKIEKTTLTVLNAEYDEYYSQRNNQYVHKNSSQVVDASASTQCNVTSLIMTAEINGWKFPKGNWDQPEDNLMNFIFNNEEVDEYYKKTMPVLYKEYKEEKMENGKVAYYTPNEVHAVLAFAFNKWIGCSHADTFIENCPISKIINELLEDRSVVISGKFGNLHHIVSLVGAEWNFTQDISKQNPTKLIETIKEKKLAPSTLIINDPYGDYHNYKSGASGREIKLSYKEFIDIAKPIGNYTIKMAHFVKNGAAII